MNNKNTEVEDKTDIISITIPHRLYTKFAGRANIIYFLEHGEEELFKHRRKLKIAVKALELLFDNISCDSSAYRDTVINDALKEIKEINNE